MSTNKHKYSPLCLPYVFSFVFTCISGAKASQAGKWWTLCAQTSFGHLSLCLSYFKWDQKTSRCIEGDLKEVTENIFFFFFRNVFTEVIIQARSRVFSRKLTYNWTSLSGVAPWFQTSFALASLFKPSPNIFYIVNAHNFHMFLAGLGIGT